MSEEELVKRLKNKEVIAFDYLYDQYAPSLYGVILKILPETALTTRVLTKSFIKAWNRMEWYHPSVSCLFIWLVQIVVEECSEVVNQPREVILEKIGYDTLPQLEKKIDRTVNT